MSTGEPREPVTSISLESMQATIEPAAGQSAETQASSSPSQPSSPNNTTSAPSQDPIQLIATPTPPAAEPEKSAAASPPASSPDLTTTVPKSISSSSVENSPGETTKALNITLLLTSTGTRHQLNLTSSYLTSHNVPAANQDPFSLTVYAVKELIYNSWAELSLTAVERPSSPGFIKLIHFGKYLDDRKQLSETKLGEEGTNVVHMLIKPADLGDGDETSQPRKGGREGRNGRNGEEGVSSSCRCTIL